jgi:hypothetical protein
MNCVRVSLAAAALAVAAMVVPTQANAAPPAGFTPLFNGKDLDGWHGWAIHAKGASPYDVEKLDDAAKKAKFAEWTDDAKKHWSVENGELVNDGKGAYLATDKDYGDIELLIEYKTVAKADSGIYLRATPQVQIWDTTKEGGKWDRNADKGSGGLFNNGKGSPGQLPLVHADKPFGEWNTFRIQQVGERTSVWLNDKLVVDNAKMDNFWNRKLPLLKSGAIILQTHGGEIRWRNIYVREIPAAEANEILNKSDAANFKPIFNGKDLTGWAGTVDGCEVKNGSINWIPKKGGNIYFNEDLTDFAARVEYKVPPGGNNGLAIRYPGTGQASQVAMCEVQVLDDTAEKYAKLDPRQFNGSVYGMVPAHKGFDRPVGEWNVMEVTVKGHTIQVELNGTRIVDADVSKITEFKDKTGHPGRLNTHGYFGFAGHNDPVEFRNVQIKKLEK